MSQLLAVVNFFTADIDSLRESSSSWVISQMKIGKGALKLFLRWCKCTTYKIHYRCNRFHRINEPWTAIIMLSPVFDTDAIVYC